MKVLIIECESLVSSYIKGILEKNNIQVVGVAENYQSVKESLSLQPSICLLDIRFEQNKDAGIKIGRLLNKKSIPFVYLTANNKDYNLQEALATKPYSFISKPFDEREILVTLELFRLTLENTKKIELITNKLKVFVPINDIIYIEANNVHSKVVTADKTYLMRITLKDIALRLNYNFIKVHRSFIVNKNKITSYNTATIYLNQLEIPLSRKYRDKLN